MKKRLYMIVMAVVVCIFLSACGNNDPDVINEDDLIRYVPPAYTPVKEMVVKGEAADHQYVYDDKVDFLGDGSLEITVNCSMEDMEYKDSCVYSADQEVIDKLQLAYQAATSKDEFLGPETKEQMFVGLSYVLNCLCQKEEDEALAMLDDVYALSDPILYTLPRSGNN